jgi:two-component system chemotaxis response regulator CheB
MIVEDSAVVRSLLAHIISRDPRLSLAAVVETGEEAVRETHRVRPDVISMDIRLPGMDGLEATRRIMSERPTPIVVIAASVEDAALRISMNALRAGALSVVEKPVGVTSAGYEAMAQDICTQLYIMSQVPVIRRRMTAQRLADLQGPASERAAPPREAAAPVRAPSILALAASTGGPPALARVLGALPRDFPIPVLVVQHMGAPFMQGFAAWLDSVTPLTVDVARHGETPAAGRVHVAPGDRHLRLGRDGALQIGSDPPVGGQRPSATALFASLADTIGPRALGVLLTGMGEDGARGLVALREAGGFAITEDESTAVVYGMPGAAARLGGSDLSLPLDLIAPRLLRIVKGVEP